MIKGLYGFAREWSKTGSVWLYSDPHFDDEDSKLMDPMWPDPDEQIQNLKACCHKPDTLVLLGDVGDPEYIEELKCYKVLLLGNHDKGKSHYTPYFDEVYEGPLFISDRILLSHEPLPSLPYVLNIHGHDHSGWHSNENGINVCSNLIEWMPLSLGKLIKDGVVANIPTIHRWAIDKRY